MTVLMIGVAIVILVGVFFVATGRGGELAYEHADHAPLDLGPVSATDVVLLRPPTALWGYNMQVTDEALERIAQAMRDRDVTIAFLQQRLADLTAPAQATSAQATSAQATSAQAVSAQTAFHPADTASGPPAFQPAEAGPADNPFQPADPPDLTAWATARQPADPPGPEEQSR